MVCSDCVGDQGRGCNLATRPSHKTRPVHNSRDAVGGGGMGEAHRARHTCEGPDVISKRRAAIEKKRGFGRMSAIRKLRFSSFLRCVRLYRGKRVQLSRVACQSSVEGGEITKESKSALFAWLINPLVRSIPRTALTNLLSATRRACENNEPGARAMRRPALDQTASGPFLG